jgi:hypothetical protein
VTDLAQSLTRRIVGAYDTDSLSGRARLRRWREFGATFPDIAELAVLDLGGDARAWRTSPVRPAHVTLLNVSEQTIEESWMTAIVGDACNPDLDLAAADLIYSNSVIEHVGGHWRRERFAEVVRSADRYWVQTPNRYFPIEPHFMLPWLQHLPYSLQSFIVAHWPLGNYAAAEDTEQTLKSALEIELLSHTQMRFYFPDAAIRREKAFGLTKSLIAVKPGQSAGPSGSAA